MLAPGTGLMEDNFSTDGKRGGREGFRMIQMHCIYCAFYFNNYYISSTSDHQVLDPGSWRTPDLDHEGQVPAITVSDDMIFFQS